MAAVQALDIDVNQHSLDINHFFTEDLKAIAAILRKYSADAAELAEGRASARVPGGRQWPR